MQKTKQFLLALGSLACTQMAMAEGVYVVGSLGVGIPASSIKSDVDAILVAAGMTNLSSSMTNGTSMAGALGYAVNDSFGVEIGYMDSGTISYTGSITGLSAGMDIKVKATQVALVGTAPINDKFSVYGKFGYSWATTTISGNVTSGLGTVAIPAVSADENSAGYGIGAAYKISDQISVRAGYELYAKDLSGVTASLVFKF